MPEKAEADTALLRLPEEAVNDILKLLAYHQHISSIVQRSQDLAPAASITGLSARIAREIGLDGAIVARVVTTLWQIKNLQQSFAVDTSTFASLVRRNLELATGDKWGLEYQQQWEAAVPAVVAALDAISDDHPLLISAKATLLAYSQQNLLMSARVITDVRPVFNAAADKIVETVITHTLLVSYRADNRPRLMTFALDQEDVEKLGKQCERAELKARVTKEQLKEFNPVILPEKYHGKS